MAWNKGRSQINMKKTKIKTELQLVLRNPHLCFTSVPRQINYFPVHPIPTEEGDVCSGSVHVKTADWLFIKRLSFESTFENIESSVQDVEPFLNNGEHLYLRDHLPTATGPLNQAGQIRLFYKQWERNKKEGGRAKRLRERWTGKSWFSEFVVKNVNIHFSHFFSSSTNKSNEPV